MERSWETKVPLTLLLNTVFSSRRQRIFDFTGEEGNRHGDGKANVCKQVSAGLAETMGSRVESDL